MSRHNRLFPPSASARWLTCTASVPLIAELELDDVGSIYAAEGILAHEVFSAKLLGRDIKPWRVGSMHEVGGFEFTIDREMHDHVDTAIEWVEEVGPGVRLVEQDVDITVDSAPTLTTHGRADVIVQPHAEPGVLHVMDLKYGRGEQVYAERNSQMMLYGTGSIQTHGVLFEGITGIMLHILQPRLDHHDTWGISALLLDMWANADIGAAMREAQSIDGHAPTFRPSDAACRWCPFNGNCKAQAEHAISLFDDLDESSSQLLPPKDLTPFLNRAPFVLTFIEQIRDRALALELSGEDVPGWKAVEGRSNRTWSEESDQELTFACGEANVASHQPPKVKSPAMLEKELGKKRFRGALERFVVKPRGSPALVPDSDKRPAWALANVGDFDVIEN